MEQCSCHPACDGDQFPLAVENFHQLSAGEFWQIHGAAAANVCSILLGRGDGRHLRQQFSWMDENHLEIMGSACCLDLLEGVRLGYVEFTHCRASQGFQVRATTKRLSHLVSNAANVGSGTH